MNLQKINWKSLITNPKAVTPNDFFKVFSGWIGKPFLETLPELFIDVADYQHVHDGPLTLLVGHRFDMALDDGDRRWGLLTSFKREMSEPQTIQSTLLAHMTAALRLEQDPQFAGKLSFNFSEIELIINDRALAPNTSETFKQVSALLEKELFPLTGPATLTHLSNPKQRFGVKIVFQKNISLSSLKTS